MTMSAGWAAVAVAAIVALGSVTGLIWKSGRHEGKLDAILVRLTAMAEDHETRIRLLEARRDEHR